MENKTAVSSEFDLLEGLQVAETEQQADEAGLKAPKITPRVIGARGAGKTVELQDGEFALIIPRGFAGEAIKRRNSGELHPKTKKPYSVGCQIVPPAGTKLNQFYLGISTK